MVPTPMKQRVRRSLGASARSRPVQRKGTARPAAARKERRERLGVRGMVVESLCWTGPALPAARPQRHQGPVGHANTLPAPPVRYHKLPKRDLVPNALIPKLCLGTHVLEALLPVSPLLLANPTL